VLPFGVDEVFVEDTYYSVSPAIDAETLRGRIADYARAQQWDVIEVLSEERGCLPVVAGGDPAGLFERPAGVAKIGVAAGLFHPLTGYSLPMAVEAAAKIVAMRDLSGEAIGAAMEAHAREHWRRTGYYRMLTRMAFGAAAPEKRYKVFSRFYGLSPRLIERFYAGRSNWLDRLRILAGKPPVPVLAAIRALLGGGIALARLDETE
jgi:lycopene beta-cyclase